MEKLEVGTDLVSEVGNSAKLVILLLDYSLTKNRIIKIPGMEWRDKRGGE